MSESERWQQVKEVLHHALELEGNDRAAFLAEACSGDEPLRDEVEGLIASHDQALTFFEKPAIEDAARMFGVAHPESRVGQSIGPYQVRSLLGTGGMGAVYQAVRADDYEKVVALKLIKRGMDTDFIISRFRHERQILAHLDHPNIARLLDGGTTEDGLPYFVMEFVSGQPVDGYCDDHKLPTQERLKIFREVCAAVYYAHQNLTVHRDIKPSNILITTDGVPKLLDFGVAKLLSSELSPEKVEPTATALGLMTPDYASPEQVRGETITTATDIYSLGVVLYKLLSGHHPYQFKSRLPHEVAQVICEKDPEKPSSAISRITPDSVSRTRDTRPDKLRRRLVGDLDNIVLKALRKEPGRRYASVQEFSEDIRRHLEGLPVSARKDTFTYRASKFIKRHRVGVATAIFVTIVLLAGAIGIVWQARIARAEREKAERRFNDVRVLANSFLFELHDSIQDLPGSTPARQLLVKRALEYLDKLSHESENDLSLQRELATAYKKVGDVQGNPYNANLGDSTGALRSYRKALDIYQRLAGAGPSNLQDRSNLAGIYVSVADLLWARGDNAGALENYRFALPIREQLFATDPSNRLNRYELARNYYYLGQPLITSGDIAGASESYRKALTIGEELLASDSTDAKASQIAAATYVKIGDMLAQSGDFAGALENHLKALTLQQTLAAAQPANATLRRQVALYNDRVAEDRAETGNLDGALENLHQALTIQKQLSDADPTDARIRGDWAATYLEIGDVLIRMKKFAAALENLNIAASTYAKLLAADDYIANRRELAFTQRRIGYVLMKNGDTAGALENYRKALPILESDSVRGELPFELANVYQNLGELRSSLARNVKYPVARRLESYREARQWYQKSLEVWLDMQRRNILTSSYAGKVDEVSHTIANSEEAIKKLTNGDG